MSITNYGDLKHEIAKWLNREDDADIDDRAAMFVSLAEARIRRDQVWFELVYSLATGGPLTCTDNPTPLPLRVKELREMWASTSTWKHPITIVTMAQLRQLAASNRDTPGVPTHAALLAQSDQWLGTVGSDIEDTQLYLWPTPTTTDGEPFAVDFSFIYDPIPLGANVSGDADTQFLLTRHPDLYLYGALVESAPYYQHDDRLPLWEQRYQAAVTSVNIERERAKFSGSPKRVRLPRSY